MRSQLFCVMQLHDVAQLNEEGVRRLIQCGQTKEALLFFQKALETLHYLHLEMEASSSSCEEDSIIAPPPIWSSPPTAPVGGEQRGDTSTFFTCDQGLLFACQGTQEDNGQTIMLCSRQHRKFYSAAIAFNMGLAFHLKARSSSSPTSTLKKAGLCYKQAIQDLNETITSSSAALSNMMKLFALNNQCKIQFLLKNPTELQDGLEEIRKILFPSTIPSTRTTTGHPPLLSPLQHPMGSSNQEHQQQQRIHHHKRTRRNSFTSSTAYTTNHTHTPMPKPTPATSNGNNNVLGEIMLNVLVFHHHQQHQQQPVDCKEQLIPVTSSSSFLDPPAAAA